MAQLAIKGHSTRGSEVIALLEMLGGKNIYKLDGKKDLWYILSNSTIEYATYCFQEQGYMLYEFEARFPCQEWGIRYDEQTKAWYDSFGMLPAYDDYFWFSHHKHLPNKKTILRVLRKWSLPKGTKVILNCFRYDGLDFEIVVK